MCVFGGFVLFRFFLLIFFFFQRRSFFVAYIYRLKMVFSHLYYQTGKRSYSFGKNVIVPVFPTFFYFLRRISSVSLNLLLLIV